MRASFPAVLLESLGLRVVIVGADAVWGNDEPSLVVLVGAHHLEDVRLERVCLSQVLQRHQTHARHMSGTGSFVVRVQVGVRPLERKQVMVWAVVIRPVVVDG